MKTYKDFPKEYIGDSDIAQLIFAGTCEAKYILFGEDGSYNAYMVNDKNASIGEHYQLEAEFDHWVRIFDDNTRVKEISADHIKVYRSGMFGCVIQYYND